MMAFRRARDTRFRYIICLMAAIMLLLVGTSGLAAERTKITFLWWGGNPNSFYEAAKAEFESLHPDIEVELVYATWDAQVVKVAGGVGDALITHTFTNGQYVLNGVLKPLNSLLQKDPAFLAELQKDFWPGSYQWAERKGTVFTLPMIWTQGLVMFYNKDQFQNTGLPFPKYRTWNDMITPFKKLSGKEGQFGIQMLGSSWHGLHQLSLTNGAGLFDDPRFASKAALTSSRVLETASFWSNLAIKEGAMGGNFAKGTAATQIYWWGQVANWTNLPFEYDIATVPPGPSAGNAAAYPAASAMLGITNNTKHPDEAYLWLKFLLSPKMMKLATLSGAGVPTRRSVALNPEWARFGGRNNQAAMDALMNAVPTQPLTPAIQEIDALLNPQLAAAFKGEKDVVAVLQGANDQVTALLQKYMK